MNTQIWIVIVLALILLLGGGILFWKRKNKPIEIDNFKDIVNQKHAYQTTNDINFQVAEKPVSNTETVTLESNTNGQGIDEFSLEKTKSTVGRGLLAVLSSPKLTASSWDSIEELLLSADVGLETTEKIIADLKAKVSAMSEPTYELLVAALRTSLITELKPEMDRSINVSHVDGSPAVILMVGVNGVGKTTTVGKLARILTRQGNKVVLGAADTFRAAASEQLQTWGQQTNSKVVVGAPNADPASVAYTAVSEGIAGPADVVIIDTAGRLHTKSGLMDELGKVKRVVEKQVAINETLLVLDATVGQNGLQQAKEFSEVVQITGVVLTKLDGTAKGGIVYKIQQELSLPVKLVGLGEGKDQLAPFDPQAFVNTLLG